MAGVHEASQLHQLDVAVAAGTQILVAHALELAHAVRLLEDVQGAVPEPEAAVLAPGLEHLESVNMWRGESSSVGSVCLHTVWRGHLRHSALNPAAKAPPGLDNPGGAAWD